MTQEKVTIQRKATFQEKMRGWTEAAGEVESRIIDLLAIVAPWSAPIPSAYLIWDAARYTLAWPWPIALAAAITVEITGVVSVVLAQRMHEYNQVRSAKDTPAPFWVAGLLVAGYFTITLILTVLLEAIPGLVRFSPALFPMFSLMGALNIGLKNGQYRREQTRLARLQNNKPLHNVAPVANGATQHATQLVEENATDPVANGRHTSNRERMMQLFSRGYITPTTLGEAAGVHKSTASRFIRSLKVSA